MVRLPFSRVPEFQIKIALLRGISTFSPTAALITAADGRIHFFD
jgi:hypothetical protein